MSYAFTTFVLVFAETLYGDRGKNRTHKKKKGKNFLAGAL